MKSFESLNMSKCSLNISNSNSKIKSVVSSPGRKSLNKNENEDYDYIPNQNKITLRKSDTYNINSVSKKWLDLNLVNEQEIKRENENLNS